MFGLGVWELGILGALLLLIFARRIPGAVHGLGRMFFEFRQTAGRLLDDDDGQGGPP